MMQRGIGALTPVQEESSTLGTGPRSGYSRKDAGVQGQGPQAKARAGPSNDSLPSIKATAGQQSPPAARGCSIKPVFHVQPGHSPRASAQQQQQSNVQQAKQQAQALAHQPLTSIAAAAAAHQQQQLSVQIPTSSSITHASNPVSPQRSQTQQRLQSSLQEHLQQPCSPTRQSTAASTSPLGGRAGSRRCSSPAKSQSKLQEEAEEDPFLAQRRLHQLPGLENVCTSSAEAEAGRRIMALPHVLCRAANGELYKMETGHVQSMMLRRHLAELGIEMTEDEEALLTTGAITSAQYIPTKLAARNSLFNTMVNGPASRTGSITPSWANRSSMVGAGVGLSPAESRLSSMPNSTWSGAPGRLRRGRSDNLASVGGLRRSAVGAALEAHAAAEAMRSQAQVILDDEVVAHITQLDIFVENWRNQLAQQANGAKAAKAAKALSEKQAAAAAAAAERSAYDPHRHRKRHHRVEDRPRDALYPAATGGWSGKGWVAVRHVVELNITNWQQHRALANRWKQPNKPPTWEDVILMGDVYIKGRSGQGIAVYEARCAELGIIPCNQVIQQLERPQANMAHCQLGLDGAKALGAALAAASNITALDLRDNGLDGKAVGFILAGIATATASALTERARQHNIQMAARTMAAIGANMQAASITQPPYHFSEDAPGAAQRPRSCCSSRQASRKPSRRASFADTVQELWEPTSGAAGQGRVAGRAAMQQGAGLSQSQAQLDFTGAWSNVQGRSSLRKAVHSKSEASWAGGDFSGHGTDCPANSQFGARGAASAGGGAAYHDAYAQGDSEMLMDSVAGQSAGMYVDTEVSEAEYDGLGAVHSYAAEAQLALQHVAPSGMSRASLAKIGQQANVGQLFIAQRNSFESAAVSESPRSPNRALGADTADLELDLDDAQLQQLTSVPASPAAYHATGPGMASTAPSSAAGGMHSRKSSGVFEQQWNIAASQQSPITPRNKGSSAVANASNSSSMMGGKIKRIGTMERGSVYSSLSEIDLSQNPIGMAGAKAIAELLHPVHNPGQFLVSLNLTKCNIPESGGMLIAAALQEGNLKLRRLSLSNNALGNKSAIAFGELLESSHTLKELDLGWNQIKAEGTKALARGLAANATLSELVLCWNGLEAAGGAALGEMLALNMGLKVLDLSHCRLGPEACLLLGEGLKSNVVLEVLLLAGNDIGEDGARHLMTALAANNSLKFLGLSGSNLTAAVHDAAGSASDFNPASPDGSYTLDLSVAAERAVAVQLVELDRANATDLMKSITLDGKAIGSVKKANWPTLLPSRGALSCNFSSSSVRKALAIMEPSKLATLRRQLTAASMSDRERLELVAMFAPFALFSCKQIASVISTFSIGPERVAASALLYTRASDSASELVSLTGIMTGHDVLGWKDLMGWYAGYRWNQPTGHYELNLALPVHAAIAARLRDDSQSCPDGHTWINLMHDMATTCQKQPQGHGPPTDWRAVIPTSGTLSLDYVSTHPPGTTAKTTVWGAPAPRTSVGGAGLANPTAAAGAAAGARASSAAASGAAAVGGARASAVGAGSAAAAGGARSSTVGTAGGASPAVSAAGDNSTTQGTAESSSAASDQQLEQLMRVQMGIPLAASSCAASGGLTMAAAAAAALSDVAAADAAVTALRQAAASGLLLVSAQVRMLIEAFTLSPHRVEVAVMCWPITLDRDDNYWTVLYCLQGIEQSNLLQRLGPWRLYHPQHASCHWVLDLCNPGHEEVAKKLVGLAVGGGELPNFWNIRLRGVKKQVNENQNMWGMLTAESFTPFLEFDFMGPDAWTAMGKTDKEVAAMAAGDKLEMRTKQAARLEVVRNKQLYPYSCDGSSWQRPPHATYESLMAPQLAKSPWVAAWDRLVRVLLRLELWAGGLSRDSSALQEAFEAAAESGQRTAQLSSSGADSDGDRAEGELCITASELEELLRNWGYNRQEVSHYLKLMEDHLKAEAVAAAAAAAAASAAKAAAEAATLAAAAAAVAAAAEEGLEEDAVGSAASGSMATAAAAALLKGVLAAGKMSRNDSSKVGSMKPSMTGSVLDDGADETAPGTPTGRMAGARKPGTTRFASGDGSSNTDKDAAAPDDEAPAAAGTKGKAARGSSNGAAGGKAVAGSSSSSNSRVASRQQSAKASALAANLEASYDRGLKFSEFVQIVMTEPPKSLKLKDVVSSVAAMLGAGGGAGGLLAKLNAKQNRASSNGSRRPSNVGGVE